MDFELEYKLKLFRENQPELFDENNERYTSTPIGKETSEMMLQLINEFESALAKAETEIKQLTIPVVSKRLGVNSKVCLKKHKNITGVVVGLSDVGFNHWMVKWDRTGETIREYGSDLVVC